MAGAKPNPFALSATPEKSSRSKLFRPKELTEIVFPDIAMIMHHLFWVKFTIWLEDNGFDAAGQNHLFLWAEKNGIKHPTKSVLYHSLLSRYAEQYADIENVSAGTVTLRNWGLFKNPDDTGADYFDLVTSELQRGLASPEEFDFEEFYEEVFAAEFKSKCIDGGVNLPELLQAEFSKIEVSQNASDEEQFESVLEAFVEALSKAFGQYDRLHRRGGGEVVISSNIHFAKNLISEVGLQRLSPLANTNLDFTPSEVATLLEAIQDRTDGEFLVGSILLLSYVGIAREPKHIYADLRQIYEIYTQSPDFFDEATSHFPNVDFNAEVKHNLERLCFYWALNFFLADGEDVARSQLDAEEDFISKSDVEDILRSGSSAEHFVNFIANLDRQNWIEFLDPVIERMEDNGEDAIAEFFGKLRDALYEGKSPAQMYLELLEHRGTITKHAGDTYQIKFEPTDSDSASFYGIDSLIGWTSTILNYNSND